MPQPSPGVVSDAFFANPASTLSGKGLEEMNPLYFSAGRNSRVWALVFFFSMVISLVAPSVTQAASVATVNDARLWTAPDHTRLVLDLDRSVNYHVFRLHGPERIVIDLNRSRMKANLDRLPLPDPVVGAIRYGNPTQHVLRVVIDVREKVRARSFLLKPMHGKPYRLVVDLLRSSVTDQQVITAAKARGKKGLVIAVDAGHGGEDPGAIGPRGVREKDITLAVAKELAALINKQPDMQAVLIRKGDYFVPLKRRVQLARAARADLMISIHADAVRRRDVKGASVYTLSERGATPDKAAAALAAKENAADEIGGVDTDQVEDPLVNEILGDMFRRDALNSSQILAETILHKLRAAVPLKYDEPKRARFVVLGALEIPSVLVELDYISNPSRERKLRSRRYQKQLAYALFDASKTFFDKMGLLKKEQKSQASLEKETRLPGMLSGGQRL